MFQIHSLPIDLAERTWEARIAPCDMSEREGFGSALNVLR